MAHDIFHQTDEEKQAQLDEHYKRDYADWDRETTECLLSDIKSRLQGCNLPYCLSCANSDALVDVLRDRINQAIEDLSNYGGIYPDGKKVKKEYGSILHNRPAKP
jgi:hypothetical protein